MRFSTRVAAAVATLPLVLGTAACGSKEKVFSTIESPAATTAAPVKAAPVVHLNRKNFVPAMSAAQSKLKSWQFTAKMMLNGTVMAEITGVRSAKPAAVALRISGRELGGKTARIILVKETVYLSMPGVTPSGKYRKVPADGEIGVTLDRTDPTKIFKALGPSLRSVKFAGPQTLDSEKLECYEATVDTAMALSLQGQPVPKGIPKTATYTMWLDSARRPRYISFEFAQFAMSMTMSGFDKPVVIKAPPASTIVR